MFHGKPIGRDGMMFEAGLKSVTGMKDGEMELYKLLVPEAFKDGKVDVPRLAQELKTKGPVVEIHVYGQSGKESEAKAEFDRMTHEWYEMLQGKEREAARNEQWALNEDDKQYLLSQGYQPEFVDKLIRYNKLDQQVNAESLGTSLRATQHYNQISPFDTKKYPVVRVDVVLPAERRFRVTGYSGEMLGDFNTRTEADAVKSKNQGSSISEIGKLKDLWSPDNLHENLPNTLGWAMVQFVPDPRTGETVMFVVEQQSRWGQHVRKYPDFDTPTHPLLDFSSSLVLKAAIREAQKRGVTKMVISDGESAMMTEQHDTNVIPNIPQTKVVSTNGQPKLVYHANVYSSDKPFQPRAGQHFGTRESAEGRIAAFREGREDTTFVTDERGQISDKPKISSAWLDIKNPKRVHDVGQIHKWDKLIREAKAEGYDGLVYRNDHEGFGDSYVVFEPN